MTVEQKGNTIVITLPMTRQVSKTGKSVVIATSNGNKPTAIQVEGKTLTVGVNAYISNS